jgi:hypothetical protein
MYHLRSRHAVTLFKLISWMLCIKWLLIGSAFGLLIVSAIAIDKQLAHVAIGLFAGALLVAAIQWIVSAQARCPLCLTPPLALRYCAKHRKARRLLGSFRLRVACSIIFRNYFRCPYCGETTAIETRADPP